jgi:hypothetical protein
MAVRRLYTDSEEVVFEATRPIWLTGIDDLARRSDLRDRMVALTLPPIPASLRRPERELWGEFNRARPGLLGGLLDLACRTMAELPRVTLTSVPRMADYGRLGVAVERAAGWPEGSFLEAYEANRRYMGAIGLEDSSIAPLVRQIAQNGAFRGSATELRRQLMEMADEATRKAEDWPKDATRLSGDLRRLAPDLRAQGWADVRFGRRHGSSRTLSVEQVGPTASPPSQAAGSGDAGDAGDASSPTSSPSEDTVAFITRHMNAETEQ